jgi:hypothetical protein
MKKDEYSHLVAYHCMPLEFVRPHEFVSHRSMTEESELSGAYHWLKNQVCFDPIFLAYGNEEGYLDTGYNKQWSVILSEHQTADGTYYKEYRKAGEFPNDVLFLFRYEDLSDVIHIDTYAWECCLVHLVGGDEEPPKADARTLFRRSWTPRQWKRLAAGSPKAVQLLVPKLDLRKAFQVWTRNKATAKQLQSLGFSDVIVNRVPCMQD